MPRDPMHDAVYLKIEATIEENYRGADGSYTVSPSAVATIATPAALAAIAEQGYTLVRHVTPAEEEADRAMWSES